MRIFIPTRGRLGTQITRREFFLDDPEILERWRPTFVVPESEWVAARGVFPNHKVTSVPNHFRLSDVRQWLVYTFGPFQVCMDDDLVFLRRWAPTDIRQRSRGTRANPITRLDAVAAFERMQNWLEKGFVHGALSQRGGNNHVETAFKLIGRATDCHFYNATVIKEAGLRFNDVTLRQDFHMTLSLLELGYENVIDYEFMTGQSDGQPGGCQLYRTHEMLESEAHRLAALHPGLVKVVEKERKGGFGTSVDVRISWQKAYRAKVEAKV